MTVFTSRFSEALAPARTAGRNWFDQLVEWAVEARAHRVVLLVLGIWLLNAFDLVFTILSHQNGMLDEENPVARYILGYGTSSVILFKIGLVMIGSYPLLRFRRARITELGSIVILVAYAVLALHWSECFELYHITISNTDAMRELAQIPTFAP
jgi:hypothetical protein